MRRVLWLTALAFGCAEGEGGTRLHIFATDSAARPVAVDAGRKRPNVPGDASRPMDAGPLVDADHPERDARPAPTDGAPPPRDAAPPPPPRDAAPLPPPPPPPECRSGRWSFTVNGQDRQVRVDVPGGLAAGAPLVVILHGNGDTADNFCAWSEICAHVTGRGAVAATPEGRQRVIAVGGQRANLSWDAYEANPAANEDLALVDEIIAAATTQCGTGDVFIWGHSQGGYFGFLVAMERADRVAGAGLSAAADPKPGWPWRPARRIPFYFLIGDQDYGLQNARQTASRLRDQGHPVEIRELPGVAHGGYPRGHNADIWTFLTRSAP